MQANYNQFRSAGAEVVAIGRAQASAFQNQWNTNSLEFIGIPDPSGQIGGLYKQKNTIQGLMPAVFVVDQDGVFRFVKYGNTMMGIPTAQELLNVINGL